ncbi:hypothetical protein EI42_01858 [Thermosporothrix hazakensis]|jgi:hypothetical protein|uniref:Uncharacterized protein n=2 Tax=Thermosporothrix TaxID=768650 RepID=A0A326U997_THEHA|nr:hypothetical protein EI42_01858 [Thermosporothrix hazakensis]BBH87681.1 hypothetical protein KTC_24320 [Thermosporothrix sp. COM3]GCE50123.1 hypothetical protein KTH_49920 [Thermosporothrix hazakensis]
MHCHVILICKSSEKIVPLAEEIGGRDRFRAYSFHGPALLCGRTLEPVLLSLFAWGVQFADAGAQRIGRAFALFDVLLKQNRNKQKCNEKESDRRMCHSPELLQEAPLLLSHHCE